MYIKIDKEGCYQAVVSYGDIKLKNGEFDILVLNGERECQGGGDCKKIVK